MDERERNKPRKCSANFDETEISIDPSTDLDSTKRHDKLQSINGLSESLKDPKEQEGLKSKTGERENCTEPVTQRNGDRRRRTTNSNDLLKHENAATARLATQNNEDACRYYKETKYSRSTFHENSNKTFPLRSEKLEILQPTQLSETTENRARSRSAIQKHDTKTTNANENISTSKIKRQHNSSKYVYSISHEDKVTTKEQRKETSVPSERISTSDSRKHYLRQTAPTKLPSSVLDEMHECTTFGLQSETNNGIRNSSKKETDPLFSSDSYSSETVCMKCKRKLATVYCMECAHYMCKRCERHHDQESALKRKHNKLKGNNVPGPVTVTKLIELRQNKSCKDHTAKDASSFCVDHIALCCEKCSTKEHSKCNLESIETLLINTDIQKLKQESFKRAKSKLESLMKIRQKLVSNKNFSSIEEQRKTCEIQETAEYMINHIRQLEEQLIAQVKKVFEDDRETLITCINQCDACIDKVSRDLQFMGQPKVSKDDKISTVITLHQIKSQHLPDLEVVEKQLSDVSRNSITFKVNEKLLHDVTTATNMGSVGSEKETTETISNTGNTYENQQTLDSLISSNSEETFAELELNDLVLDNVNTIFSWMEDDTAPSTTITALCLLDDGSLLLSDQNNCKVKWFDKGFTAKAHLDLDSEPWGMTQLNEFLVIATLPSEQSFVEIDLSLGSMVLQKKVGMGFDFTCVIKSTDDKLIFAGYDGEEARIVFTDINGSNSEEVFGEQTRKRFKRPNHIIISNERENVIFISDVDRGVFGVDVQTREILFQYTHPSLKCCMGITESDNDQIIVCSQQTNSLHVFSSVDGANVCIVPTENIVPQTIRFIPQEGEYLLTADDSYKIIVLKLV